MAGGFSSSSDDDVISGINVTPLVDIVLVLLIVFMITAPVIYQSAIHVQLPKAQSGEKDNTSPLQFSLTKDGALYWGKELTDWKQANQRLQSLGEKISKETAIISADQATPHGTVIRLLDTLRQAGLTRIGINVEARP
jgi:biopolymer transport protein ExbD